MKVRAISNCVFKSSIPHKNLSNKILKPALMIGAACSPGVNTDLFVKNLSDKEQENALYNMGDLVCQLKDAGYPEKKPEKYDNLLKKLQGYCNKYNNNETIYLKDIDDFVNDFMEILL
ncbi:MAG: hypothetical protein MJ231_07805 [bacterium]|nr:hypothetical protein [bacterium]